VSTHNSDKRQYLIEERRRIVAKSIARGMTQMDIAKQVKCDQSTISDDVRALKEMSQQFIFDLAKSDLGFYYKQCIDGIEDSMQEAWKIYTTMIHGPMFNHKDAKIALECLKITIQANEAKHRLLSEGPNILAVKAMEDRLNQIERTVQEATI
jgi:hypothetical protein